LYGPLLEIEWILIIHNNCIFPYYGYSIEIVWIYYGFSGAIANFITWISHILPSVRNKNKNKDKHNLPRVYFAVTQAGLKDNETILNLNKLLQCEKYRKNGRKTQ
jgi:hypothetical protein